MFLEKIRSKRWFSIVFNKYIVVLVGFGVFVTFFDNRNLLHRISLVSKNSELEKELKYYKEEIKNTNRKKHELQSSNENLEKFAREEYLMKNKNEDIFIIRE